MHSSHFDAEAVNDGRGGAETQQVQVTPLGIPLLIQSTHPAVLAAATSYFAPWAALPPEWCAAGVTLHIDVVVQAESGLPATCAAGAMFRSDGTTVIAVDPGAIWTAHLDRGYALVFVAPELVANPAHLGATVLERIAYLLAGRHDRTPLHAAAVAGTGTGIVLLGAPEIGISSLCYAAQRVGLRHLADPTAYVSLAPELRLWGGARVLHLPVDAGRWFGELAGHSGESPHDAQPAAIFVPLAVQQTQLVSERITLCLVERAAGRASHLTALPAGAAYTALAAAVDPGPQAQDVVAALAAQRTYRLQVGSDMASAAALLSHLSLLGQ